MLKSFEYFAFELQNIRKMVGSGLEFLAYVPRTIELKGLSYRGPAYVCVGCRGVMLGCFGAWSWECRVLGSGFGV